MEFDYTAEQEGLIRTLRAFGRKELAPRSREWDRTGELDRGVVRRMGELGLLGLRVPAEYGGQETDLLTMGIAVEEIARADFGSTTPVQAAALTGGIVGTNGTEEVKRRWLPPVVRGDAIVALALTEPEVGSDAASLACRAETGQILLRPRSAPLRPRPRNLPSLAPLALAASVGVLTASGRSGK
ncbi:MAG TPA: acyl-CoA dehydrogenase family protein, partial [Methylomirabilota bacterium]|nr:acyl-CoA dehydrogenase family protein [Methylomirabilota bacterium]